MKHRSIVMTLVLALAVSLVVAPIGAQDAALTIYADETRSGPLADLGEQFEADTGIALEIVEFPSAEIRDQFTTAAPAGEGPDIVVGAHDWLGELVVNGLLEEVDLGDKAELFTESSVNAFNYEGTIYGMPYAVENVALYYNTSLVEEAPTTWAEVREISESLVESGDSEFGWVIQENDPYHFFPVQTAFGGFVFGFDAATGYNPAEVGIDSEGTVAAFTFLDEYVQAGLMPTGLDGDSMNILFEEGQAAMVISGPWNLGRYQDALGDNLGIAALPGTEDAETGSPFLGVQGFMISAFSEQQELANLFLTEYVATEEVMQLLYDAQPRPPAFIPVGEALEDESLAAFTAAGANGLAMPAIPEMSAVWANWGGAMEQIVQDRAEPDDALTAAAESIREAIAGEGE
ncbi:MAG: maltose ABC transporter substrate-binding protein [Chloroflexota bacterium]